MASREELLNLLWRYVINAPLGPTYLSSRIERAEQRPNDPFADAGPALKRLLAAGAEPRDIAIVCREAA